MNIFKKAKTTAIISALAYVLIGLLLAIWPTVTATTICYVLAAVLMLAGIIALIGYFASKGLAYFPKGLVTGLFLCALSLLLLFEAELIIKLIPAFLGICILVSGFVKLCHSISLHRAGYKNWTLVMAVAVAGMVFGLLMTVLPFKTSPDPFYLLVGIGLIYSGITDLWTLSRITKRIDATGGEAA